MKNKQVIKFNQYQKLQNEKRIANQRVELKRLNSKYKVALDSIKLAREIAYRTCKNCSKGKLIVDVLDEALFNIKGAE